MTPERDLLTFYAEAGVDALLGEAPVNRFASAEDTAPAGRVVRQSPAPDIHPSMQASPPPPPPDEATSDARTAAKSAATLDELPGIHERLQGCSHNPTATQLVFAYGNPKSLLMFVCEAPGRDEDIEGLPFVGRSGKLLDRMLAAIGLDRTSVYIANIVPWRPPGNRTPTPQETAICLPFTQRQIELVDPDVLVCLGNPSTQTVLATKEGITRTRGRWFRYQTGTREIRAMPTFHPAFLLRNPISKRLAWRDFLAIKKALAEAAS